VSVPITEAENGLLRLLMFSISPHKTKRRFDVSHEREIAKLHKSAEIKIYEGHGASWRQISVTEH
jgi:hypothetical protein